MPEEEASVSPSEETGGEGADAPLEIDFSKRHPLEHSWTLWFDNPTGRQKQATWGQTLRSVYTFSTVEDFWCLYNNIVSPSRLIHGTDFHLFKEGIEPKWEDPKCAKGGKWTFFVPKGNGRASLDDFWLNLLLAMIGEQFAEPSEICGAVVSVRQKQDRIALWTRNADKEAIQVVLGKQFKSVLSCEEGTRLGFMVHDDQIRLDRKAKDRYTV